MNVDYVKAIIGASGAIIGVILTTVLKHFLETRTFSFLDKNRRRVLTGVWKGTVIQHLPDGNTMEYEAELTLRSSSRKIKGQGKLYHQKRLIKVELSGAFRNDQFLKMDYDSKDYAHLQFGSFILQLSPSNKKMKGRYVGYGHISENMVYGAVELEKE